jgi:hypothetical protein
MARVELDPIHWQPGSWDQILGCRAIVEHYTDVIHGVRVENKRSGFNTLITGLSFTGKTGSTSLAIKCLTCQRFDALTLTPCPGVCEPCSQDMALYKHEGYTNILNIYDGLEGGTSHIPFHCIWVDCASVTASQMDEIFDVSRKGGEDLLVVVYFDEVHNLVKKSLDDRLLTPTQRHRAVWIASSAYIESDSVPGRFGRPLDVMLLNRFKKRLKTTLPSIESLTAWLFDRCLDFKMVVDEPEPTLTLLAKRARQIPGHTLEVLSEAWHKGGLLTRSMVENHIFNFDRDGFP